MSVSYISSEAIEQATTDGSQSLTVPSDCDYITVCATGFNSSVSSEPFALFDQMDFDDTPSALVLTEIDNQRFNAANPDATVNTYGITATDGNWPGTGAQTFYYDIVPTPDEGIQLLVSYWKGVDQSSPIVDTDASDRVSSFTSSLTGMAAGDMGVICAYRFSVVPDMNPGSVGQTVILAQAAFNGACFGLAYELGESALQASGSNLVPVAFGIAAAGDVNVSANTEALTITEQAATISVDVDIAANVEALTITEFAATIELAVNISAATESLIITEQAASIVLDINVNTATESLVITSFIATIEVGSDTIVNASTEALTLSTQAAGIAVDVNVGTNVESLVLTALAATISTGLDVNILASVESLEITGLSATIANDVEVSASTESIVITPLAASITAGGTTLTSQDITNIVDAIFAHIVENSETFNQQLRLIRAEAAGKLAVSGSTVAIRDAADTKNRITATVDNDGQRTSITTDVS